MSSKARQRKSTSTPNPRERTKKKKRSRHIYKKRRTSEKWHAYFKRDNWGVLDPDGWRQDDAPDFETTKISCKEFVARYNECSTYGGAPKHKRTWDKMKRICRRIDNDTKTPLGWIMHFSVHDLHRPELDTRLFGANYMLHLDTVRSSLQPVTTHISGLVDMMMEYLCPLVDMIQSQWYVKPENEHGIERYKEPRPEGELFMKEFITGCQTFVKSNPWWPNRNRSNWETCLVR